MPRETTVAITAAIAAALLMASWNAPARSASRLGEPWPAVTFMAFGDWAQSPLAGTIIDVPAEAVPGRRPERQVRDMEPGRGDPLRGSRHVLADPWDLKPLDLRKPHKGPKEVRECNDWTVAWRPPAPQWVIFNKEPRPPLCRVS